MTVDAHENEVARLAELVRSASGGSTVTEIHAESRFVEDLGMESINRLMLMTLVERECGLSLEQHMPKLLKLQTVGDMVEFLRSLAEA
jgi:acyl carrier protein